MSIKVAYIATLRTTEILSVNAGHQATGNAVISELSTNVMDQTGTSTPACTLRAGEDRALVAGASTIDLTNVLGTAGAAVNGTGKRVQYIKFVNGAAAAMTISKGGTNGYDGFGSAFSITIAAGGEALVKTSGNGSVIGGSNKTLDIAGTATQVLSFEIVFG